MYINVLALSLESTPFLSPTTLRTDRLALWFQWNRFPKPRACDTESALVEKLRDENLQLVIEDVFLLILYQRKEIFSFFD